MILSSLIKASIALSSIMSFLLNLSGVVVLVVGLLHYFNRVINNLVSRLSYLILSAFLPPDTLKKIILKFVMLKES
jgi:biotin transporter BioY